MGVFPSFKFVFLHTQKGKNWFGTPEEVKGQMKMLQRVKRKTSQVSMLLKKTIIKFSPCQLEPQYLSSSALKELYHVQSCSKSKQRKSLFICFSMLRGLLGQEGSSLEPIHITRVQSFPPPVLVGVMKAY